MESDLLGLNLSVLHVNLVSDENNGNVLANADEILVPLGDILVGDARAHIEHDDGAVSTDAMKLCVNLLILLTSSHHEVHRASPDQQYPKRSGGWDRG